MLEELGPGLRIVGIDENPDCLTTAQNTLQTAGVDCPSPMRRVTTLPYADGFRSAAVPIEGALPEPVALLQADVCSDLYLEKALRADGPFDAVTVWLTGVHMYRQYNVVVTSAGIKTDGSHRLFVQNAVYELADKVLRPGGVLQVVDRGEAPATETMKQDIIRAHREQAEPTTLDFRAIEYTPWTPTETRRVPMGLTLGTSGMAPTQDMAIVSIISVKT
ncbi:hypothetical protein [Muricoccus nepalensis]|nr:hypothetical protein [Roseomonas nepalensis]